MIMVKECNLDPFAISRESFANFCKLADRLFDKSKREGQKTYKGMRKVRAGDTWF